MLTATQVACEAELCDAEAMCIDSGEENRQAAPCRPGLPIQEQDWQEVVYRVSSFVPVLVMSSRRVMSPAAGHLYLTMCAFMHVLSSQVICAWALCV